MEDLRAGWLSSSATLSEARLLGSVSVPSTESAPSEGWHQLGQRAFFFSLRCLKEDTVGCKSFWSITSASFDHSPTLICNDSYGQSPELPILCWVWIKCRDTDSFRPWGCHLFLSWSYCHMWLIISSQHGLFPLCHCTIYHYHFPHLSHHEKGKNQRNLSISR